MLNAALLNVSSIGNKVDHILDLFNDLHLTNINSNDLALENNRIKKNHFLEHFTQLINVNSPS